MEGCGICRLKETHPGIVYVLDTLHAQGVTMTILRLQSEPVFAEAKLSVPTSEELAWHYNQHTALPERAAATDDYESDYFELRKLYRGFLDMYNSIVESISVEDRLLHSGSVSRMVKELGGMLKTLSIMRNNEKLFSAMLLRHTEFMVAELSLPVGRTLREVRDQLLNGESPTEVARGIDEVLSRELMPAFESAAHRAIEQSTARYKLH